VTDDRAERKERARKRRLETAYDLEQRGHVDHAVKEFLRAKAPSEAARLLASKGRLADAGDAVVQALRVNEQGVAPLAESDRRLLTQAVAFYEAAHRGADAARIEEALAAAPPPPADAEPRALGEVQSSKPPPPSGRVSSVPAAAPEEQPTPRESASSSSSPSPPVRAATASGSFRPPVRSATASGSFRPPVRSATASGSFRPPVRKSAISSGSFRPPVRKPTQSDSFRAPRPSPNPEDTRSSRPPGPSASASPPVTRPPATFERPEPKITRAAIPPDPAESDAPPVVVGKAPAVPTRTGLAPDAATQSDSRRAPRATPAAERAKQPSSTPVRSPALSASGEKITDYQSNRASGWRDADDDALERSITEHLEAGRKGSAARVAREAGQIGRALSWFMELGLHSQAGACLRALGQPEAALEELLKQEPSGAPYRKACFDVIALAIELDRLEFDVDHFLTRFVADGPADRDEVVTYVELAQLYVEKGFEDGAKRCLRKVLEHEPDHAEGLALDAKLRKARRQRASASIAPRVSGPTAKVRGLPPLPTLEEYVKLAREHAPK